MTSGNECSVKMKSFRLGFRLAREAGNQKIYSMDYESQMNLGALKSKLNLNPYINLC